jgi:signal transduction histidine kinase
MFKENEDCIPVIAESRLGDGTVKSDQTNFSPSSTSSSALSTAKTLIEELERFYSFRSHSIKTLAHELRSPISNMEMAISMLEIRLKQKGLLQNSEYHLPEYLSMLRRECDRSIRLTNELQTGWVKTGQPEMSRMVVVEDENLPPLEVQEIADLCGFLTFITEPFRLVTQQRQQVFNLAIAPDLPCITTNQSALTHILTELLTNACRYTPAGETMTFSASIQPEGVSLGVASTGVQIPSSQLPFIFDQERFVPSHLRWQAHTPGLGLALIRQLAEQIGATLEVDSADQQTVFTVLLPV